MTILQGGIPITGFISPTDVVDLYPTHRDEYGYGGHRTVPTLTARDNISSLRRVQGMTCYVLDVNTYYVLYNGVANTDWRPIFNFFNGDLQLGINLPENYILIGDVTGKAVPSPALIDVKADLMLTRQADYIIGHPSPKLPNAQVLSTMMDGLLYSTGGVISTTPTGGGGSGLNINLVGEVTGNGIVGGVVPTVLQLTLDQIKLAVATVDLNNNRIKNLNSVVEEIDDAINYDFLDRVIDGTLTVTGGGSAIARIKRITSDLEVDSQLQRIIFGTQSVPESLGGFRLDNARAPGLVPTETILAWGNVELSGYRINHITDSTEGIGIWKLQSFVNNVIVDIFQIKDNNFNLFGHRVTNAGDPVDAQDYITKAWGLANLGGGGSGGVNTLTGVVTGTAVGSTINTTLANIVPLNGSTQVFRMNSQDYVIRLENIYNTSGLGTDLEFYNTIDGVSYKFATGSGSIELGSYFEFVATNGTSAVPKLVYDIRFDTTENTWVYQNYVNAEFLGDILVPVTPANNNSAASKKYVDDILLSLTGDVTGSGTLASGNITATIMDLSPSKLSGYPTDGTKFLNGAGNWVTIGGSGGPITIVGVVEGFGTGTIGTTLNPNLNISTDNQILYLNYLNNKVILYNSIQPTTGQTGSTNLKFQSLDGYDFDLRYYNPADDFTYLSLHGLVNETLGTDFEILRWKYSTIATNYISSFNSSIHVNATVNADTAGLYINGGFYNNITDDTTVIRASGTSNHTKIKIDNNKTGGTGRPYSLDSDSTGNFHIVDEVVGNRITIDTNGDIIVGGTYFGKVPAIVLNSNANVSQVIATPQVYVKVSNAVITTIQYSKYFTSDGSASFTYSGLYPIYAKISIIFDGSYSASRSGNFVLFKNNTLVSGTESRVFFNISSGNSGPSFIYECIIPLLTNDKIDLYIRIATNNPNVTFTIGSLQISVNSI